MPSFCHPEGSKATPRIPIATSGAHAMHIPLQPVTFEYANHVRLLPGEYSCFVLEGATLSSSDCTIGILRDTDISGERGRLQLTSRRIVWMENGSSHVDHKRSCSLDLHTVSQAQMSTGKHFLTPRQLALVACRCLSAHVITARVAQQLECLVPQV